MKTSTAVAIGAGVVVVGGVGIYLLTRSKTSPQLPPTTPSTTTTSSFAPTTTPTPQPPPAPPPAAPTTQNTSLTVTGNSSVTMHVGDQLTLVPPHAPASNPPHPNQQQQWVAMLHTIGQQLWTQHDFDVLHPTEPTGQPFQPAGKLTYLAFAPGQAAITLKLTNTNENHTVTVTVLP